LNEYATTDDPLFNEPRFLDIPEEPSYHTLDLCDFWDSLTKGETRTTKQVRQAFQRDLEKLSHG
jgi:hypothetical protein